MGHNRLLLRLISLAAVALIVFAACGEDEPPASETGGGDGENGAAAGDFTLATEGHLTVGSDIPYAPFEFEDDTGAYTGFDVELVRAVSEKLGLENTDDDWLSLNFDTIFLQLQRGTRFDIVVAAVTAYAPEGSPASQTVADRRELVDFTLPYYPSLQSLTVNTDKTPDITGVDALPDGARIAVQSATTGAFYAQETLTSAELVEFPKASPMYQALLAGQVEGVFNDLPVSIEAVKGQDNLEVVEQVETGEEYAMAVNKDNPALKDAIDQALQELFDDGTYAEIFKKYFPDQDLPDYASE
ncbi:MAG: transporter substrate-binding domain-containing protein [Actinomycetota bacterium]